MHEDTETTGSIETSESAKRQHAESSPIHNGKDTIFCHLFPQLCGRKVTGSEDSKNTFTSVGEKPPPPDEITPLTRIQSPTSTEITLPPTHLTPVLIEKTSLPPPEETLTSKENQKESLSPDEIIKTFGKESSGTIQEQRTNTPPTYTTPSVDMPMFYPVRCSEAQPSSREVRPPSQKVSPQRPFIRSPIKSKQQNSGENSLRLESIELEERPAHSFGEYRKLPSPSIRSSGATHSQRNRPSLPKGTIPQKTPTPKMEIHPDVEQAHPSIRVSTSVGRDILNRQDVNTHSLRHHMLQRNTKRINFTICALVVIFILILGLLLLAFLFIVTLLN